MLMPARRRRMRSMAKAKSPAASSGTTGPPKRSRASRASCQEREARMTPFEGTQPTLRQSPPIRWRSIRATLAPKPAEPAAEISPAVPAPITTMWYRSWGSGLVQESGWTLSRSLRLYSSFGSTGKVWTFRAGLAGSIMVLLRGLGVRRVDLLAQRLAGQAGDEGGDDDRRQQADSQEDPELWSLLRLGGAARQVREAAQRLAVVDVEEGAGEHRRAGGEVVEEGDLGQSQGIVQQVEGEDRGEPQQGDDLEALAAHRTVDGGELCVAGDLLLDAGAGEIARDEKGARGAERGSDQCEDCALRQTEDDARGEGEQRARHEGDGGDGVAQDEDDRAPDSEARDPLRELGDVVRDFPAAEEERGDDRQADDDVEDQLRPGFRSRGRALRGFDGGGCVHLRRLLSGTGRRSTGPTTLRPARGGRITVAPTAVTREPWKTLPSGRCPERRREQHAADADDHRQQRRRVAPARAFLGGLAEQHQTAAGHDELPEYEDPRPGRGERLACRLLEPDREVGGDEHQADDQGSDGDPIPALRARQVDLG